MIKLKLIILFMVFITVSGCTEFAMLMSGGSFAASQNSFVKVYNAADFGVVLTTKKGIKKHAYDSAKKAWTEVKEGKEYIYDKTWGLTDD